MSTGDSNDVFSRLKSALPQRWFGSTSDSMPVVDSVIAGVATALSFIYSLYSYAVLQTRIRTATDGYLDLIAADFFGTSIQRKANQTDASFRATIIANMFRERATRHAIVKVLQDLTGRTPKIVEPKRPADTGTYGGTDSITVVGTPQIYRNDWQGNQLLYATARTNLLTQSQAFENGAWTKSNMAVTVGAATAPDGTLTAEKLADNDSVTSFKNTQHTSTSVSAAQTVTQSVYAKAADRQYVLLRCISTSNSGNYVAACFDLVNVTSIVTNVGTGTGAKATITPVGNGWFRCAIAGQPDTSGTGVGALIAAPLTYSNSTSYAGTVGQGVYIWGAQLETSSAPTSYIPTTTAAVTVTDYTLSSNGALALATAPVTGAVLSWTGSYVSAIQSTTVNVTGQTFAGGDGLTTSFSLAPKYGYAIGYGAAGAYGSLLMPYQCFVIAYRPLGTGIPNVAGYGISTGGYGQASQAEWASLSMIQQAVTDADIYAAIDSVRPAATIVWTNIQS